MENPISRGAQPQTLYIAQYSPQVTFDSAEEAIRTTLEFVRQHPPPRGVRQKLGGRVIGFQASDQALLLQMDHGHDLLVENAGHGGQPRVRLAGGMQAAPGYKRLADDVRVAWFFPHGDPGGEGRERSGSWMWSRQEELRLALGLKLTDVMVYPEDLSLYFREDESILTLSSVYEENTLRSLLYWSWYEWRGK